MRKTANLSKISFKCLELHAGKENPVKYNYPNPHAEVHFFILNVRGDSKVLSAIIEKEANLFSQGYNRIIGLRDMYSDKYQKYSPGKIDEQLTAEIIASVTKQIKRSTNPNKIGFYFATMEIEAWILAMYNLFRKIDANLTVEHIEKKLEFNLKSIDPQKEFYQPSIQVAALFTLIGREYKKKLGDTEMLCSKMDETDSFEAIENGRCKNFDFFLQDLEYCLP